jgi:HEAT repeat.
MAGWKLRRGDSEWPVESIAILQEWARSGRVNRSDYVFNPILEKWMYAEEVIELRALIATTPTSPNQGGLNSKASQPLRPMIAIGGILFVIGIALIALAPGPSTVKYHFNVGGVSGGDQALDYTGHKTAVAGGVILIAIGVGLAVAGVSQSKSPSVSVPTVGESSLGKIEDPDRPSQVASASHLKSTQDPARIVAVLRDQLRSPDWRVRERSASSLGDFGGLAAIALQDLEMLRKDPDLTVRTRAAWAVEAIAKEMKRQRS